MPFDMLPTVPGAEIVPGDDMTNEDAIRVLERARQIIRYPWHWTIGASARNWKGEWVTPLCDDAFSFCGHGALERAAHELGLPRVVVNRAHALVTGEEDSLLTRIPDMNDHILGYFRVHRAFARAVREHKA